MAGPALVWFRDDLRLADNPALTAAVESGAPLLCFYVLDEFSPGLRALGGAARWWLHGSLRALGESVAALGSELLLLEGAAEEVIGTLVEATNPSAAFWNRRYGAAEIAVDSAIKTRLSARGIVVRSFNGKLLNEPWEIKNRSGRPFQVFTPYLRSVMTRAVQGPLSAPRQIRPGHWPPEIREIGLSPGRSRTRTVEAELGKEFPAHWQRGEAAALRKLEEFLDSRLQGYARNRDFPGIEGTSRLSPHLRFGEIGPRQVWHAVSAQAMGGLESDSQKLLSEVVWRDFSYQLLYQHPHLPKAPHLPRFARFPWADDPASLRAWQMGRTGYPIVDAGMRQLWRTGWMHNRVRMIVASFLVKHLLIDWRQGEAWFWDTLVDADPANNAFGWQWIAGSGPDSAPFHRIFNPVSQGEKFDPEGDYIRAHVPELAGLPAPLIHRPWAAPPANLGMAGVALGETYPMPIVPHEAARERALRAFRSLRNDAD